MPNLNDNKDYALLLAAYKKVQDLGKKLEIGASLPRAMFDRANSEASTAVQELQALHDNYSRLLDWLNKPENSEAKAEFAGLEICKALNHFFSA